MSVFLSQQAHVQGVEAQRHSHSRQLLHALLYLLYPYSRMVKLRNAEDELAGAKPEWGGCGLQDKSV